MLVAAEGHRGYRFGEFLLDLDRGALFRNGEEVRLRPKSFSVLRLLVERQGKLVSRDELLAHAWPGVIVTDDSLTQCLIEIRRALGDTDRSRVRTVPRRGFIFEIPVERVRSAPPRDVATRDVNRAALSRWLLGVGSLLIGGVIGWWALLDRPQTVAVTGTAPLDLAFDPPPQSIAVLAFEDMSAAGDEQWLADGLSEEVLNLLAQVPELTVIARTSSFVFRDSTTDIRTIAERLNVAHVLEGSVRRDNDTVRVTAQLVDARTEAHLWSQVYDRSARDVFGMQDDIAGDVARVLKVRLLPQAETAAPPPRNPGAWAEYIRAMHFFHRRMEGDLDRAEQHYRAAVDLDPGMARAWAGLAGVYHVKVIDGLLGLEDGLELQRDAVERALTLAPQDAVVLNRLARYHSLRGDLPTAETVWQSAYNADPNHPFILSSAAGRLAKNGDFERAIDLQRRAAQRDPLAHANHFNLAYMLFAAGHYAEATREFRAVLVLAAVQREDVLPHIAMAEVLDGRPREALRTVQPLPPGPARWQVEALAGFRVGDSILADRAVEQLGETGGVSSALLLAEVHAANGHFDRAVHWLETAEERLDPALGVSETCKPLSAVQWSPILRRSGDPRITAWLAHAKDTLEPRLWAALRQSPESPPDIPGGQP